MMRMTLLLGLALLAGAARAEEAWEFRCPVAGAVVRFEGGRAIAYEGPGEAPLLCRVAGRRTPWVLGAGGNEDPLGRALFETLRGFFPARPGARAGLPPRDASGVGASELVFAGFESVDVAGRPHEAARVDFAYRRSAERRQRLVLWLDRASGALLRMIYEDSGGTAPVDARAVALELP